VSQPEHLPRLYGDKEVGQLLKRATELQREESEGGSSGQLSLRELEEIAAEAGIDPRHLRRAALEMESGGGGASGIAGESLTLLLDRTVPGELPGGAYELLVPDIQAAAGSVGQPSLVGRTLTWRSDTPSNTRSLQVVVTSRDGETHVRIEERLHQLAGGLFGGIMGGVGAGVGIGVGVGVGVGALGSVAFALAFPLSVIGGSYWLARRIFQHLARGRRRALTELMERVVARVTDEVEALPPAVRSTPSLGRTTASPPPRSP
jgi:hypothetical protein